MSVAATADLIAHAAAKLRIEGSDEDLKRLARSEALALTPHELRSIAQRLGRHPTRAETHAFAIQWSEHCSYKSSRALLAALPTTGPDVVVGIGEDAGILRLGIIGGKEYGVVVAHESHNHPSQVVPFEGAATGVGGILRDVLCMGARVVASADPLRFGPPAAGSHAAYVAGGAVDGIAAYGNAVGVPNIGGDVYFHPSFRDNCLVNVVALGFVERERIIHSRVPKDGVGYDLVLVGKATDASGFGGAAFASLVLDEDQAEANKSAVQVPDPFLKNVIMRASYAVFDVVHERGLAVGFKDLGAGGIMGSSSELCSAGGFGAAIDIDAVPTALAGLSPFVVAMAETQERMLWAVPPSFTPELLAIYNERFSLPEISANARAAVIGTVTRAPQYVVRSGTKPVIDLPIEVLTKPVRASWPLAPRLAPPLASPQPLMLEDVGSALVRVLSHHDVCSRRPLIERYDSVVRGATAIPSGYGDAGVLVVQRGAKLAVALSVDGNARYGAISAKMAAAHAVVEAARNVAAVGATPIGLTDCLNYGNPEDPVAYRALADGIEGLAEAARAITVAAPDGLPFVSGNVSLYNHAASGSAIVPSAVVACIGRVEDVGKTVAMQILEEGQALYLIGARPTKLGGSVLADVHGEGAGPLPAIDYAKANAEIKTVIAEIQAARVTAAHDISDGGLLACVAEMCLGGEGTGTIGAVLDPVAGWAGAVPVAAALFAESGGFVVAVTDGESSRFEASATTIGAQATRLGVTGGSRLIVRGSCDVTLDDLRRAWLQPLEGLFA